MFDGFRFVSVGTFDVIHTTLPETTCSVPWSGCSIYTTQCLVSSVILCSLISYYVIHIRPYIEYSTVYKIIHLERFKSSDK